MSGGGHGGGGGHGHGDSHGKRAHGGGDHGSTVEIGGIDDLGKWLGAKIATGFGVAASVAIAVLYGVACLATEVRLDVDDGPFAKTVRVSPGDWSKEIVINWRNRACDYDVDVVLSTGEAYQLRAATGQTFTEDELVSEYWFWPVRFFLRSDEETRSGEAQWAAITLVPTRKKGARGLPGQIIRR